MKKSEKDEVMLYSLLSRIVPLALFFRITAVQNIKGEPR